MPKVASETSPRTLERDEIIDLSKKSLHSKVEAPVSVTGPPKPKRDWSSLTPDYVNVEIKQNERGASEKNIKMKLTQHNSSYHDSVDSSSEFLDQQMASSLETGDQLRGPEYENVSNNSYNDARGKLSAAVRVRNRERRNSFRQAVDKVDGNGRPYEQIWFQGDGEEAGYQSVARGNSGDAPIYVNMTASQKQSRKSDTGSTRSASGHIRSGSYDNIPTPGPNTSQAIFTLDPNPTAYEIINFSPNRGDHRKQSSESQTSGLQSVGLVAEALREHERSSQSQPTQQILSKQNSAGSLRAPPPPYQNPPGPGPPPAYTQFVSPPKHTSPNYHTQVQ